MKTGKYACGNKPRIHDTVEKEGGRPGTKKAAQLVIALSKTHALLLDSTRSPAWNEFQLKGLILLRRFAEKEAKPPEDLYAKGWEEAIKAIVEWHEEKAMNGDRVREREHRLYASQIAEKFLLGG